jgi:hypothetical protein
MEERQYDDLMNVLTEIRNELRMFVQLLQEPGPAEAHVHTPADGSPATAPFWVCQCGYVHDDEQR